jgi:pimeloyl-ACP methyl ester carboxylesterase
MIDHGKNRRIRSGERRRAIGPAHLVSILNDGRSGAGLLRIGSAIRAERKTGKNSVQLSRLSMLKLATTRYPFVLESRDEPTSLVVLLHGYACTSAYLNDLKLCVKAELPRADLLIPDFPSSLFSNADPQDFAEDLVRALNEVVSPGQSETRYREIVMVGHSVGALIARKAYVFAKGETQDRIRLAPADEAAWADRVRRIILMAGMNRGWSVNPKPRDMSWHKCLIMRCATVAARLVGFGRFALAVRRGSPFVTNLRIQWLNLIRSGARLPLTVQLLGDTDDVVSELDNIDVESGAAFRYIQIPNTGHANSVSFSGDRGKFREAFFRQALTATDLVGQPLMNHKPDPTVKQFVFVVHGIRDLGFWTRALAQQIESAGIPGQVRTTTASYGYFPMLDFLLFGERQKNVRWFMDEYTQALAMYPDAEMNFVGHSNGTYLLASALARYRACSFRHVVFAGSVVPRRFPWDQVIPARVKNLRNYVAAGDWVVGIFPRLFEYFASPDVGSAGFRGFENREGNRNEFHFVRGGHSAALATSNFRAIASFVLEGKIEDPPRAITSHTQSGIVTILSRLAFLPWTFCTLIVIAGGYLIFEYLEIPQSVLGRLALYLAVVIAILRNI